MSCWIYSVPLDISGNWKFFSTWYNWCKEWSWSQWHWKWGFPTTKMESSLTSFEYLMLVAKNYSRQWWFQAELPVLKLTCKQLCHIFTVERLQLERSFLFFTISVFLIGFFRVFFCQWKLQQEEEWKVLTSCFIGCPFLVHQH